VPLDSGFVKLTYRLSYGGTTSDSQSDMPSDLVGWAGFEPATSASRTDQRPCYQVFCCGVQGTGWCALAPISRLLWRKRWRQRAGWLTRFAQDSHCQTGTQASPGPGQAPPVQCASRVIELEDVGSVPSSFATGWPCTASACTSLARRRKAWAAPWCRSTTTRSGGSMLRSCVEELFVRPARSAASEAEV
jgi:hypothetical protein